MYPLADSWSFTKFNTFAYNGNTFYNNQVIEVEKQETFKLKNLIILDLVDEIQKGDFVSIKGSGYYIKDILDTRIIAIDLMNSTTKEFDRGIKIEMYKVACLLDKPNHPFTFRKAIIIDQLVEYFPNIAQMLSVTNLLRYIDSFDDAPQVDDKKSSQGVNVPSALFSNDAPPVTIIN